MTTDLDQILTILNIRTLPFIYRFDGKRNELIIQGFAAFVFDKMGTLHAVERMEPHQVYVGIDWASDAKVPPVFHTHRNKTYGDDHGHPGCHGCQICWGNDLKIAEAMGRPNTFYENIMLALSNLRKEADARLSKAVLEEEKRATAYHRGEVSGICAADRAIRALHEHPNRNEDVFPPPSMTFYNHRTGQQETTNPKEPPMPTTITPLKDRILIRRSSAESISPGGIIIPENVKEKPIEGVVIRVGKDVKEVHPENRVLFGKYAGNEVKLDGEEFLLIREEDVLAVLG